MEKQSILTSATRIRQNIEECVQTKGSKGKFDIIRIPEGEKIAKYNFDNPKYSKETRFTRRLDILPFVVGKGNPGAEEGMLYYERTYHIHKIKDPITGMTRKATCLKKTFGEPCPACEMQDKMRKDPQYTKDEIKEYYPKKNQLFLVVDIQDNPDFVYVLDVSMSLFGNKIYVALQDEERDSKVSYYQFFNPKVNGKKTKNVDGITEDPNGKTLKVTFERKKFGSANYCEAQNVSFLDREEEYEEDFIKGLPCLDDMIVHRTYEEVKQLLFGEQPSFNKIEEEKSGAIVTPKSVPLMKPKVTIEEPEDEVKDEDYALPKVKVPNKTEEEEEAICPKGYSYMECDSKPECEDCPVKIWDKCNELKQKKAGK